MLNRREFLKAVGAAGICLCAPARLEPKPNIILILIDDLGWRDVGFMGSKFYETPNMNRLAREGMVFTDAYANAPNCAPSRACLLSGQYTPRHGIYTVNSSKRGKSENRKLIPIENKTILDQKFVTLAEALKPGGYQSASMGKWHLGDDPELGPLGQGFDVNIGGGRFGHPPAGYFEPFDLPHLEKAKEKEYLTDRLTEEALSFIDRNAEGPFFLYLPHYAVHTPIQAKAKLKAKYKKKKKTDDQKHPGYGAMIESVDQGIGAIQEKLKQKKIEGNTLVILFSDNGGHGGITSNKPLRGAKGMLYEGGIRVPLAIRWPKRVEASTQCHEPVIGLDLYPTLLEATGLKKPDGVLLDGESLCPLLFQTGHLRRNALFWHFPAYLEASRKSKSLWRTTPAGAVRSGDYKLIEFFEDNLLELYDLKKDPEEKTNLAQTLPEKTKELHTLLKQWRKRVKAPVPCQKNPEYKGE